jgi:hypothetical protein
VSDLDQLGPIFTARHHSRCDACARACPPGGWIHADCDPPEPVLAAVLALAERNLRAAVAADIEAALAADRADSDVSSGEAIWEQGGYRNGLSAAADIARGTP